MATAVTVHSQAKVVRILLSVMVLIVLVQVLPESISEGGWLMLLPFGLGMAIPSLIERLRDHNHAHTVPLGLIAIGLIGHALLDGAAMAAPDQSALGWAVVLHRIPAAAATWMLVRPAWGRASAIAVLVATGIATLAGVAMAEALVHAHHGSLVPAFTALVAGSLLHVVTHRPHEHAAHSDADDPHHEH